MMDLKQLGEKAVAAKYILQDLSEETKNAALCTVANALVEHAGEIILQNQ